MGIINILIISSAIIIFIILWMFSVKFYLDNLKKRTQEYWQLIEIALAKRYDLMPNLIETVRKYTDKQGAMLERLINVRHKAIEYKDLNATKIELEYDLTRVINKIIDLGRTFKDLSLDTNFLELRKEIDDLEKNLEEKSSQYNEMVRSYNRARKSVFTRLWAKIFKHYPLNIFEIEI